MLALLFYACVLLLLLLCVCVCVCVCVWDALFIHVFQSAVLHVLTPCRCQGYAHVAPCDRTLRAQHFHRPSEELGAVSP